MLSPSLYTKTSFWSTSPSVRRNRQNASTFLALDLIVRHDHVRGAAVLDRVKPLLHVVPQQITHQAMIPEPLAIGILRQVAAIRVLTSGGE